MLGEKCFSTEDLIILQEISWGIPGIGLEDFIKFFIYKLDLYKVKFVCSLKHDGTGLILVFVHVFFDGFVILQFATSCTSHYGGNQVDGSHRRIFSDLDDSL